ncbi:unnamed protein product [Lactuca saligna]|uniref:HIG1 domain-containing protein n=1 Tax=Lactuca saligna TaxID=75948 RepID=A0AA36A5V6_LACSI|nr:unnamed protein product [Lactuca saligna]
MSDSNTKSKIQSMREWVVEHKLRAVGSLWLSGIAGSIAYNWSQPGMKTSVRIIHARLHAQALTLAALAGAAVVEYYDHKSGTKSERYANRRRPLRLQIRRLCHIDSNSTSDDCRRKENHPVSLSKHCSCLDAPMKD